MFYNQLVSSYKIVDKDDLKNFSFVFKCKHDPIKNEGFELKYYPGDFQKLPADSGLFKLACHHLIKKENSSDKRKDLSLAYQVLAQETALIGIMKQKH